MPKSLQDFDYRHFSNHLKPAEIIRYLKLLENTPHPLKCIIKKEIDLGNKITNISQGWSEPDSVVITLQNAFSKIYQMKGVTHTPINNIHYGKDQYSTQNELHIVIGPF
ncbi:hypothetical protein FNH22_05895 [Fulvivirga sp. M361]|uniref:hypothetical protein n=1 Tax=Fulvivirga sp. M361 TaxID=2594266 RepID=UPI001179BB40|nr:hypothetical protein [Fulvivirga sp. M361]TRX60581.1 hypothetical protein FNH22_05895 [Fulvivirga sp. M361]